MRRSSFSTAGILYAALWMTNALWQFPAGLGFGYKHLETEHCQLAKSILRGSFLGSAGFSGGQGELKGCAARRIVGSPQAAAVRFHNGAADPQSYAGAVSFGCKKRI